MQNSNNLFVFFLRQQEYIIEIRLEQTMFLLFRVSEMTFIKRTFWMDVACELKQNLFD